MRDDLIENNDEFDKLEAFTDNLLNFEFEAAQCSMLSNERDKRHIYEYFPKQSDVIYDLPIGHNLRYSCGTFT